MLSARGGKSRFEHLKVNETPVVRSVDGKFVLKILGTLRTFSSLQCLWRGFNCRMDYCEYITPLRSFDVPEVLEVQVVPFVEVRIVPEAPTIT